MKGCRVDADRIVGCISTRKQGQGAANTSNMIISTMYKIISVKLASQGHILFLRVTAYCRCRECGGKNQNCNTAKTYIV